MSRQALSRRYARALLSLALELEKEDSSGNEKYSDIFSEEIKSFTAVLKLKIALDSSDDAASSETGLSETCLDDVLLNPSINNNIKMNVLNEVLNKLELNTSVANFIRLIQSKNRMVLFHQIVTSYQEQTDQLSGRVRAEVTTAQELSFDEKDAIRKTLAEASGITTDKIFITYQIDPEIIGGVIARVGNILYDASISSRLTEMKNSLLNG
jgi:F-type H+-transporting ATPase subunit delta